MVAASKHAPTLAISLINSRWIILPPYTAAHRGKIILNSISFLCKQRLMLSAPSRQIQELALRPGSHDPRFRALRDRRPAFQIVMTKASINLAPAPRAVTITCTGQRRNGRHLSRVFDRRLAHRRMIGFVNDTPRCCASLLDVSVDPKWHNSAAAHRYRSGITAR